MVLSILFLFRCKPKWAAGKTQTSGLSFTNSPNKVSWKWTMDGHYHDLDGTLCGTPDCKVVQKRDIYDPSKELFKHDNS